VGATPWEGRRGFFGGGEGGFLGAIPFFFSGGSSFSGQGELAFSPSLKGVPLPFSRGGGGFGGVSSSLGFLSPGGEEG